MKENKQKRSYRWLVGVAAALAVFVAIPNVSPAAAAAMEEIPGLGAVVRVITFRDYQYDDGHSTADVHVPELGGSGAADEINDQVQAYTDQLIAQFQTDCEAAGESYQGLDVTSSVVTDSDTWFTLRIDATRTEASGYNFTRFYHINKATGEAVTLSDLFRPDADYVSVLSAEVLERRRRSGSGVRRVRSGCRLHGHGGVHHPSGCVQRPAEVTALPHKPLYALGAS